jgi:hypothetical protein
VKIVDYETARYADLYTFLQLSFSYATTEAVGESGREENQCQKLTFWDQITAVLKPVTFSHNCSAQFIIHSQSFSN